jgi:Protein of unknown function (DUF3108)
MASCSSPPEFAMKGTVVGLVRLAVALLLALAVHVLMLWAISLQLQPVRSSMALKATPLFTRQITTPFAPTTPITQLVDLDTVKKKAVERKGIAQEAIKTEAFGSLESAQAGSIATTPTPALTLSATVGPFTDTLAMQGMWPIDTRLSYDLVGYYGGDLSGNATLQWTRDSAALEEGYQIRLDLDGVPMGARLISQGRLSDKGLIPQVYEEQWLGNQKSVVMDATNVVLANGKRIARPLLESGSTEGLEGVQDFASQLMELGHRFTQRRAYLAEGEVVRIWLAGPDGISDWVYDIGPAETMTLPLIGSVQIYHLRPRSSPSVTTRGAISAEIWFAPALQFLPMRIKFTLDKDAYFDLTVQKIEQRY